MRGLPTFGEKLVEVNGSLPAAGERTLRSLEGVLVEPGVGLDDPELGVAVPSGPDGPDLRGVLLVLVRVAPNLKIEKLGFKSFCKLR